MITIMIILINRGIDWVYTIAWRPAGSLAWPASERSSLPSQQTQQTDQDSLLPLWWRNQLTLKLVLLVAAEAEDLWLVALWRRDWETSFFYSFFTFPQQSSYCNFHFLSFLKSALVTGQMNLSVMQWMCVTTPFGYRAKTDSSISLSHLWHNLEIVEVSSTYSKERAKAQRVVLTFGQWQQSSGSGVKPARLAPGGSPTSSDSSQSAPPIARESGWPGLG